MAGKCSYIVCLAIMLLSNVKGASQTIYADEFFAVIKEQQSKIDLIRQGVTDAYQYFDLDNASLYAANTNDPDAYLDYILARYYRMVSKMNYAAAEIASEVADFIVEHKNDGVLSPQVISEGIAKYRDMTQFFLEFANQQDADYKKSWQRYSLKYGEQGIEIFSSDNYFLSQYGIFVSD